MNPRKLLAASLAAACLGVLIALSFGATTWTASFPNAAIATNTATATLTVTNSLQLQNATASRFLVTDAGGFATNTVAATGTAGSAPVLSNSPTITTPTFNTRISLTNDAAAQGINLFVDAANSLALRNGVNAQSFRVYNTFTDSSNYERAGIRWSGNALFIGTQASGSGALREISLDGSSIFLQTASTSRWQVASSGHIIAATDNIYDIGQSGATRPRNIYAGGLMSAGTHLSAGSGSFIFWTSRSTMSSPSDGVILLSKNATNDFDMLKLGGVTAGHPALKRSGTNLVVRLADDSADTRLTANDYTMSKTVTAGGTTGDQTINKASGSVNFAAAAQSITVTCNLVDADSIIAATVATDDATAFACKAIPGSGSFVLKLNAAATAETRVNFLITN